MEGGLLSLKWNDHSNTFFDMLSTIRRKESYCDVTLVSDGRFYPVHKLVLSTCSEFFDNLFSRTDCKHPVVIVANVSYKDLEALLNYMYLGEVNVLQNELGNLMKAAEVLRVKGLAENKPQNKDLRDTYRSSPSEFTDAGGKRKRSEDVNSPTAKRSAAKSQFSSDPQALKNTVHDNAGCSASETSDSKEPFSSSKGLANVPPAPSQEPGISAASRGDSRDQGSNDKAVRPEVKVEEILIKDEPGGWFGDCEEVGENVQFSEPDTSLDYNPQSMDYSGSCLPWELPATTQPHPIEGHLPQGMPGASGMQGMQDFGLRSSMLQLERYRTYDVTKRTRNFVENWRLEFPWVKYDAEKREMTCTICVQYCREEDKSRFISGNTNFKRLALVRHDVSLVHQRCVARKEAVVRQESAGPF